MFKSEETTCLVFDSASIPSLTFIFFAYYFAFPHFYIPTRYHSIHFYYQEKYIKNLGSIDIKRQDRQSVTDIDQLEMVRQKSIMTERILARLLRPINTNTYPKTGVNIYVRQGSVQISYHSFIGWGLAPGAGFTQKC